MTGSFDARRLRATLLAAVAALAGACASGATRPPDYAAHDELQAFVAVHGATDARFEPVRDRPWMMVDLALRYHSRNYPETAAGAARRAFVDAFVVQAAARGRAAMGLALERIAPAELARHAAAHGLDTVDPRAAILAGYEGESAGRLTAERAAIATLTEPAAVDYYWQALLEAIEPSIMSRGRVLRRLATAPAVPLVAGWIAYHNWHDYRGPIAPEFAASAAFAPRRIGFDDAGTAHDRELLARHAPLIVQEHGRHAGYPAEFDQFGTVALVGDDSAGLDPVVDSAKPALYAFLDTKTIQDRSTRQLVYVLWYPQHPALSKFDPEAGPLDGWTVRVTLDQHERPLVVESVSNCGCYYKIFPSDTLEALSAAAWPAPLPSKTFHLEQHLTDSFDAVVPETVHGLAEPRRRIVLYFSAGHHQLVTVRSLDAAGVAALAPRAYTLRAYDELERLPVADHRASLFGEDGLVRKADRRECALLTPSGLYHAGHPRQRETQMIYFDEADFDDPALLERYLRLPPDAFGDQV